MRLSKLSNVCVPIRVQSQAGVMLGKARWKAPSATNCTATLAFSACETIASFVISRRPQSSKIAFSPWEFPPNMRGRRRRRLLSSFLAKLFFLRGENDAFPNCIAFSSEESWHSLAPLGAEEALRKPQKRSCIRRFPGAGGAELAFSILARAGECRRSGKASQPVSGRYL